MSNLKKKVKEQAYNDCWVYILLLATLVILLESLKSYTFNFSNVNLTYAILFLPLVYFLSNYITKKYDYRKAVAAIAISGVASVLFIVVMNFALGRQVGLSSISGEFCGYVISQFLNLTIYTFLLNNTKSPVHLIFLTYLFSLIVYYMFYTLIYLNMIILDNFWDGYLITLLIQFVICFPLAVIDKRILRGSEKETR